MSAIIRVFDHPVLRAFRRPDGRFSICRPAEPGRIRRRRLARARRRGDAESHGHRRPGTTDARRSPCRSRTIDSDVAHLSSRPRAPRLVVRVARRQLRRDRARCSRLCFLVLSWQTQSAADAAPSSTTWRRSQQRFADLEARRQRERRLQAAALAENPTLKAAVDTYQAERASGTPSADLRRTIQVRAREAAADLLGVPALSVH